jgi:hypothetical protein
MKTCARILLSERRPRIFRKRCDIAIAHHMNITCIWELLHGLLNRLLQVISAIGPQRGNPTLSSCKSLIANPSFREPLGISVPTSQRNFALPVSCKQIMKRSLEKIHSLIHRTRGVGQKHLLLTLRTSSAAVCICIVVGLWMRISLWQLAIICKSSTTL